MPRPLVAAGERTDRARVLLMEIDPDRTQLPDGKIGVGPWLEPLLPQGIGRGEVALVYGRTGVGATTLALMVAAYAAGYGEVVWFSTPGCESPQRVASQPGHRRPCGLGLCPQRHAGDPAGSGGDRPAPRPGGLDYAAGAGGLRGHRGGGGADGDSRLDQFGHHRISEGGPTVGLSGAADPAHLYRIARQHAGVDPNPLVVTDKRTGDQVVLELGEGGLFLV